MAGCLLGIYLRREGFEISIYEKRIDPRSTSIAEGRSINLALSHRGIHALKKAGAFEEIENWLIPMHGRMIHDKTGQLTEQLYGKEGQSINSVGRNDLNKSLIQKAESLGVTFFFNHKCEQIDLKRTQLTVSHNGKYRSFNAAVILGADGAFSVVRQAMMRLDRFNYSQDYISHGYKEISMKPIHGSFQMSPNHLHIWPRGSFMLIALPNPDQSFTCTLFYPHDRFDQFQSTSDISAFFKTEFPDVTDKIVDLSQQFLLNPTSSLVTIRSGPWYNNRTLLIGDAAHAIVPFYGQGMNAAFEDCRLLTEIGKSHDFNWTTTFESYYHQRKKDADAIAQLALDNFLEMRDHVADDSFLLRKKKDAQLHDSYGERWIPMYTMVTFEDLPYHIAQSKGRAQERALKIAQHDNRLDDDNYCFTLREQILNGQM